MTKKEVKENKIVFVKWLSELDKESGKIAGGKGANLAEMYNAKFPVPPAFVITAQAYNYFLEHTGIKEEIDEILKTIDIDDTADLEKKAEKIRKIIIQKEMPDELGDEIVDAYEALDVEDYGDAKGDALSILKTSKEPIFVAVRSSATTEDLATASFAGQQETFLNVKGKTDLIEKVKKCFASLFTARAVYYRKRKGFSDEEAALAVIVQKMIDSDKSGVIFTNDPLTKKDNIVIEAGFGLGEGIVSGQIKPDNYLVSRNLEILKEDISMKKIAITRNSAGENIKIKLNEEKSRQKVLSTSEIKQLANISIRIEEHYKKPQDIEFAIEAGKVYIVQTRPITTLETRHEKKEIKGKILVQGTGASPGIGSGKVKIVSNLDELEKVKKGDILVTEMTNPDMVVTMQRAAGIVTDAGGQTCHAAIVSREMGIACIVGTGNATKVLKDEQEVTVDGYNGKVYEGRGEVKEVEILPIVETKTKIKVSIDLPDFAERAAKSECKAIGLLRIEDIIAFGGIHPLQFLKENKLEDYEKILKKGIGEISKNFEEIWIRTSDIRTDEYRNLKGAPEKIEFNPMLGLHGIRASLKQQKLFESELLAMKSIAEKGKKIGIMFPQVISVDELRKAKEIAKKLGLIENKNIKLGVMIETPAAVQIIEQLCEEGIDFISFGTNDLTQYTLAIDRGNENVQYIYDEMNSAVLSQLAYVIAVCKKYNVETSICGQAANKKEMVEFLVKKGIDGLSVNPDSAKEISVFVKELEDKGLVGIELEKEEEEKAEKVETEKLEEKEKSELIGRDIEIIEEVEKLREEPIEKAKEALTELFGEHEKPQIIIETETIIDFDMMEKLAEKESRKTEEKYKEAKQAEKEAEEIVEEAETAEEIVENIEEKEKLESKGEKEEEILDIF